MGLTDGHLAWGDDIPTESEKMYYRQIANLEKENARLLKDREAYKKAIEDIRAEIELIKKAEYQIYGKGSWNFVGKCLDVIDKHTSGAKEREE